jgi:hypothetical protein
MRGAPASAKPQTRVFGRESGFADVKFFWRASIAVDSTAAAAIEGGAWGGTACCH